jgi:hypothetical protein
MKEMNKYTINVRRETFVKGIRAQQRENYKAEKRARLFEHHGKADKLYDFRLALKTIDLRCEQRRVVNVSPAL